MLSGSQLAGGLDQIPYLLASVLLQPALKRHHQVDKAKAKEASNIWVVAMKISVQFVYEGYINQKGQFAKYASTDNILLLYSTLSWDFFFRFCNCIYKKKKRMIFL